MMIQETLKNLDPEEILNKSCDELIEWLGTIQENFPNHSLFRLLYHRGYYDNSEVDFNLLGSREESEVEKARKTVQQLKALERSIKAKEAAKKRQITLKQKTEETDRKEYERLKAKFS